MFLFGKVTVLLLRCCLLVIETASDSKSVSDSDKERADFFNFEFLFGLESTNAFSISEEMFSVGFGISVLE